MTIAAWLVMICSAALVARDWVVMRREDRALRRLIEESIREGAADTERLRVSIAVRRAVAHIMAGKPRGQA